jgi:hypothetical protein
MANATPSRIGQNLGAGDALALFYKLFTGEVLTAYEVACKLKPTVRVRNISSGRSAGFNATFDAVAQYHTAGAEILGQNIQGTEIVVTLDDLLIAPVFIPYIDELMNHFDVRFPYANALGRALALLEDRTISQVVLRAARDTTPLFPGDGAGSSVTQLNVSGTANFGTSGNDLISALNIAKQRLDENDVPIDTMPVNAVFRPAQFYLIANTDKNLNRDFGGSGTLQSNTLRTVSDITVHKSNGPLFGFDVTPFDAGTNADGIVRNGAGAASATLPRGGAMPQNYPTKYHADATATRGLVWVEPAVAYLQLAGLQMESQWDIRRQGTLMVAKMAVGLDKLRSKCAVEIRT